MGHMAEAEAEAMAVFPDIAEALRGARKKMESDPKWVPEMMSVIGEISKRVSKEEDGMREGHIARELLAVARELTATDRYTFHEDPGHAWLEVGRDELERLGILREITNYSYQKGNRVFLEEDSDAGTFLEAKKKNGERYTIRESFKENTPIRGYRSFRASDRTAADAELRAVAKLVKEHGFLGIRGPLHLMGFKKIDFRNSPEAHWSVKGRGGKTIVVINRKYADPGTDDIVVGKIVVGYM
jgi:hypothetical protein